MVVEVATSSLSVGPLLCVCRCTHTHTHTLMLNLAIGESMGDILGREEKRENHHCDTHTQPAPSAKPCTKWRFDSRLLMDSLGGLGCVMVGMEETFW